MLGRILAVIGGLVVIVLFVALIAPYFIDWSSFRSRFEDQASRMLGKKVAVAGAVDMRFLPFPSVTLNDVRVGLDAEGEPQLQAARFSMDMELAPLLSGQLRIFDMRIEQPRMRLRILRDGRLDWMRGSPAAIDARQVVLEDLSVADGEIEVFDERSGRQRLLSDFSGVFSANSLAGPWRGEGAASLDGQPGRFVFTAGSFDAVAGRLPLRLRLFPEAFAVELDLDGAYQTEGELAGFNGAFNLQFLDEEDESEPVQAPVPGPRMRGDFRLTGDAVRVGQYRLEIGTLADPYVVTGEARLDTGETPQFLLTAEGQQIDVNRLGEGALAKTGRNAAGSAQRRINAFIAAAARIPIPQVPGRVSLKLPAVVVNDTTLRDIRLELQPAGRGWTVDNLVATLPGRTQLEAKGSLTLQGSPGFSGDLLIASQQPSGLSDWLTGRVAPEIRALGRAGLSARVDLGHDLQRFENLELAIGPAVLKGRLERQAQSGHVPALSLDLAGDGFDLDAMRALASLLTGDDIARHLVEHRIAAALQADSFSVFGVTARKLDTVFSYADSALDLTRLTVGDVEGVSIAASGSVEGPWNAPNGSGNLRLRAEDASRFLAMLSQRLPAHPLLSRLAASSSHFADSDLAGDLAFGGREAGLTVKLNGRSNGSALAADLALPGLFAEGGDDRLDLALTLENPAAQVLLGQAGLDPLPMPGDGEARLRLQVKQAGTAPAETALAFETPATRLDFSGAFNLRAEAFGEGQGRLSLSSADIEPYLMMHAVALPQIGTGLPVSARADVALTATGIRLSALSGEAGGNRFSGDLDLRRGASPFPASGRLVLDRLDLAWLAEAVFASGIEDGAPLSTQAFGRPLFGNADVALALKAGRFDAAGFGGIEDFSARLAHTAGGLAIEEAKGRWNGGDLSGRLMLSNADGVGLMQWRLLASDAQLQPVVWQNDGEAVAGGSFDLDLSVESTGRTLAELVGAAGGSATLRLRQLSFGGIDADALAPMIAELDRAGGEVSEARVRAIAADSIARGRVVIDDITVPVTISGAEARVQTLAATAGSARLTAEGRFDPVRDRINAALSVTYDAGDETVAAGDPTLRLVFTGALSAPQRQLDAAPLAGFLSQRAFERERRRVEMLQASVMEKQRLRREAALFQFQEAERQAARERAEAEARARIEQEAARAAAEAQARAEREAAEQRLRDQPEAPIAPLSPPAGAPGQDFFPPPPAPPASPL